MPTCWKIDGLKMLALIFGGTRSAEARNIRMIRKNPSQKCGPATMKPPNKHESTRVNWVRINLPGRCAPGVGRLRSV